MGGMMSSFVSRRFASAFLLLLLWLGVFPSHALINGGFEATPFSTGWSVIGVPQPSPGLVVGSTQAARFSGGGQALTQTVAWGGEWHVDAYIAVKVATTRQFSLIIYNGASAIVNVRYEAGAWATFNGTAFINEPSLGSMVGSVDANNDGDLNDAGDTKNVYRMRLTGRGFGSAGAMYDLQLSDANGSTFTKSVVGMTRWQTVSGATTFPNGVKFGSEFGSNPGWWLDEVTQHVEAPPPGPITLPYVEDFSAATHRFNAASDWAVVNGSFRNTIASTPANGIASFVTEQLGGPPQTAPGFLLSSKFTLVNNTGTGNTVGFGLMAANGVFTGGLAFPYYLIDLRPAANTVRCMRVGINNTLFLPESALQTFTLNPALPFTLEVRGAYEFEALKMDITVKQGASQETFYVVDSVPLTVGYFGFRNRTNGGLLTVDCDDFVLRRLSTASFSVPPVALARVGQVYSANVLANSNVGAEITLSTLSLPAWLTFSAGPAGSGGGTLSGTPSASDLGLHSVHLSATDVEGGHVEERFSVSVVGLESAIISEFLAENDSGLRDEDRDQPDWIELLNPTSQVIDLSGWALSDDPLLPQKWVIPAGTTLAAGELLTIFASGKNRTATLPLHTNFRLSNAANGHLQLTRANGSVASQFTGYPSQRADRSYGVYGDHTLTGYFLTPTPGAVNSIAGYAGFVGDTQFLVGRGYYSTPVQEVISCPTPGATIVYTTDGSVPSLTNGVQATSPVNLTISSTTVLRASAFAPGLAASGPDTQSYFFAEDIRTQSANGSPPPRWPQGPVNGQILDYGMDARITNAVTPQQFSEAMLSVPTLSLVTDLPNLFDKERGIYVNPYGREDGYECPVSVELVQGSNTNTPGFQIDAGLRIRGGASREGTVPKHNFHLYFRGEYGASKLRFPLFGAEGASEFDRIDLRTAQVMGWAKDASAAATYTRDEWNRLTHGAMGQPYTRSRYYHLYINGHYWGLYGTQERADADYAASYYGGAPAAYDVMKTYVIPHRVAAADGDAAAWTQLFQAATAGFATDAAYFAVQGLDANGLPNGGSRLLDVDNLIDYNLLRFYSGDDDAPVNTGVAVPKNFYALRPRDGSVGYRFLTHDSESCMRSTAPAVDVTTPIVTGNTLSYFNPRWLSQQLATNAKYRLRFADRAQKHLFHGGALDTPVAAARWQALGNEIRLAMLAESARWGDAKSPASPRTVAQWDDAMDAVETGFMATRRATLIGQLRTRGLFPALDAPSFSQAGGLVPAGFSLGITAPVGSTIFFTLDGADPMHAAALSYSGPIPLTATQVNVKARARSGSGEWSALTSLHFTVGAIPAAIGNVVFSEVHYNPSGSVDDAEFIELQNLSNSRVDLNGVQLTGGVTYTFGNVTIEPGERVCVCVNETAFRAVYGLGPKVLGTWAGALNNAGETLGLVAANGQLIDTVSYDDAAPWPLAADGLGPSLVRVSGEIWRLSAAPGGNPGGTDEISLASWLATRGLTAGADPDGNGLSAAVEFAIGYEIDSSAVLTIEDIGGNEAKVSWRARIGAVGTELVGETGADLQEWQAWTDGVESEWLGSGLQLRSVILSFSATKRFFRLRVR